MANWRKLAFCPNVSVGLDHALPDRGIANDRLGQAIGEECKRRVGWISGALDFIADRSWLHCVSKLVA